MSSSEDQADLLIIGGGVLGAFHAYHAIQRGLRVILLERNAAPQGASVRNFGQVVPSGMDDAWQRYGRESLRIYDSIQSQFDISVRRQGSIYIASDEEEQTLIEELHAINADNDYPSQLWTAQQCRERYPLLKGDYCRGGLYFPEEVSVNPRQMIHRLHHFLAEHPNYRSHFQTWVGELTIAGDGRVTATATDGRVFSADKAILCCGAELQTLYPALFRESDLQAVKLQMLRLRPQPEISLPGNILTGLSIRRYESFSQCPSWQAIKSREADDSPWKRWGVHILFKQEADGGIILGDTHEYAAADRLDELSFDVSQQMNDYVVAEAKRIFELPRWDIETAWYGVYCQTGHPSGIFTRTIDDQIHIVTGIGGKGMSSGAGFSKHHLGKIYDD